MTATIGDWPTDGSLSNGRRAMTSQWADVHTNCQRRWVVGRRISGRGCRGDRRASGRCWLREGCEGRVESWVCCMPLEGTLTLSQVGSSGDGLRPCFRTFQQPSFPVDRDTLLETWRPEDQQHCQLD